MSLYVVTGGAGFIGSHIAETLVESGERVRVFDNFSTGCSDNLAKLINSIEVIDDDLRDYRALEKALADADYVLHQAAQVSAPQSVQDPLTTHEINVTGTLNLMMAAKSAGVRRVVIASSCAVYGDAEKIPIPETAPTAPLSPYAASKLADEQYACMFHRLYGLEVVCLRYFNVFGPRQDPTSLYAAAIPIFTDALLSDRRPIVYGDGEQTRDFVYVGDVARANLLACHSTSAPGRVFNIGGGARVSVNRLLHILGSVTKKDPHPVYSPERPGDIRHSGGDITLARSVLGFEPRVTLEEGMGLMFEWFVDRKAAS